MKKILFIPLMLFASACIVGCSSDDDESNSNENTVMPVNVTDDYTCYFFNAEWPDGKYSETFFTDAFSEGGEEQNVAYVINSRQELANVYTGERDLPEIDFGKYTLIIGQQILPCLGHYLVKKDLVEKDGLYLYLYVKNDNENLPTALQRLYYWGLYPKLSQEKITVAVFKDYKYYPDRH